MCHILGVIILTDLYLANGIVGHGRLREVAEPAAAIAHITGARHLVLLFPFLLPQSEHADEGVPLAQGGLQDLQDKVLDGVAGAALDTFDPLQEGGALVGLALVPDVGV